MKYHQPVLLRECIEALNINPASNYVDATFGGGGHSREIIKQLTTGKVIAFDQDPDAAKNAARDNRFLLVQQNFRFLKNNLKLNDAIPVNGVLADLGISSHQLDTESRGFAARFDAVLDMRMNPAAALTAGHVVNRYPEEKLEMIFRQYGELKNAKKLAMEIAKARKQKTIATVSELKDTVKGCIDRRRENQYLSRVFQALRIEVNDELGALREMLSQCIEVIERGGRLVVISYHSLEDRMVKNFMKAGNFSGEQKKDFYGNVSRPFIPISKKAITPSKVEIEKNPRSRSAKMRVAERM